LRGLLQEHGIELPVVQPPNGIPVRTSTQSIAHTPVLKAEQRIVPEPLPRTPRRLCSSLGERRRAIWVHAKADRDWKAYLRAKDEDRKKVDRQTRKFRPLTDELVRGHLVGDNTVGIYPLLQDETCWFLAVDFDKKTWQKDATAFLAVCGELKVPAALER